MPGSTVQRTPLRRVSQGSLRALSKSSQYPDAPHGLGFLEPAMAELADEADALQVNVEGLRSLSQSLETFNESFASYLYVMNMNALTVDWPEAPTDASFELAKRRAEQDAQAARAALQAATSSFDTAPDHRIGNESQAHTTFTDASSTPAPLKGILKNANPEPSTKAKKKPKAKLTAKEKKERNHILEKAISCLPLEFRGQDPTLRRNVEFVIESLLDSDSGGLRLQDMVRPDVNQARVNKCLLALVRSKIVYKDNSSVGRGAVLYYWSGVPT